MPTDYRVKPGFCLGCGKDLEVKVPTDGYRPIADAAHPGWCAAPACLENRKTFRAVADRILER